MTTPDGWWWLIPFSDGTVSVGVVMPSARFAKREGTLEELFESRIAATPEVRDLLDGNGRLGEVRAIPDYSYRTPRTSGDGFCLVGDAACFLDPVFSSGVLLAMSSGEMAAEAIGRALSRRGRVDAADFLTMERRYGRAISRFSRFVHGFYKPHVLETFYTASPIPLITGAVTTVLAGAVFRPSLKSRCGAAAFHLATGLFWLKQRVRGRGAFARDGPTRRAGPRVPKRLPERTGRPEGRPEGSVMREPGFRPCSPGGSGCNWRARTSRRRGSGGGSSRAAHLLERVVLVLLEPLRPALPGCGG
ncbi:MAG: tryptophan 7-halogenase [Holophagales bacterium]|nr:tryptophan 7-halogenase [Holophagales bacterium]